MYKEVELKEEELTKEQEELKRIMQDNKEYTDVKSAISLKKVRL